MPDENKEHYSNIFVLNTLYPDVSSIFSFHLAPIDEIKNQCLIVLDTNILLLPYVVGKEDLLNQCKKIYGSLSSDDRLFIPGQVAREFAKNRQDKLSELHQQLVRKKQIIIKQEKYPLLSSLDEFNEIIKLGNELSAKLIEYQNAIDKVIRIVKSWNWNDPVSMLYHEVFLEKSILDIQIDEDFLKKELVRRKQDNIPPGYKDAGKKDDGIGDLVIWYTLLELGKKQKKHIIFVTGDEKADWYRKSEGQPLYPRYELVDEFRRVSDGCFFYIVSFSRFLELYGANEQVVEEVKQEEKLQVMEDINLSEKPKSIGAKQWIEQVLQATSFIDYILDKFITSGNTDISYVYRYIDKYIGEMQSIISASSYNISDVLIYSLLDVIEGLTSLLKKGTFDDKRDAYLSIAIVRQKIQDLKSNL